MSANLTFGDCKAVLDGLRSRDSVSSLEIGKLRDLSTREKTRYALSYFVFTFELIHRRRVILFRYYTDTVDGTETIIHDVLLSFFNK